MRLDSGRIVGNVICLMSLLAFASTPLLAQTGIDLLDPEQVLRAGEKSRAGAAITIRATLDEPPNGVLQATHVHEKIQYDDGEFENFNDESPELAPRPSGDVEEWAQRFEVETDSAVVSAEVCFLRPDGDLSRSLDFKLRFYGNVVEDGVSNPGRRGGLVYSIEANEFRRPGQHECLRLRDHLVGRSLDEGFHWVGIEWNTETQKRLGGDHYTTEDKAGTDRNDRAIHATEVRYRTLPVEPGGLSEGWLDPRGGDRTLVTAGLKAVGIRLEVEATHPTLPDPDPDPDPDPEPPPEDDLPPHGRLIPPVGAGYANCVPTVSPLVFEGDYRVSLCYETAAGKTGEAGAGIYKSSQSGLLWFFDSENAEVLVKVLDGCDENGYRWVFMAAATDVAFHLYVTDGRNPPWSYHNKLGEAATTQTDNAALKCRP